jgi:hypothetical protein
VKNNHSCKSWKFAIAQVLIQQVLRHHFKQAKTSRYKNPLVSVSVVIVVVGLLAISPLTVVVLLTIVALLTIVLLSIVLLSIVVLVAVATIIEVNC